MFPNTVSCISLITHESDLATTGVSPICRAGDAVKAKYKGGTKYDAHIASINGNTITVNWSDGDPRERHVASTDVYKNGVRCQFVASPTTATPKATIATTTPTTARATTTIMTTKTTTGFWFLFELTGG